jgi:hypothetical protein
MGSNGIATDYDDTPVVILLLLMNMMESILIALWVSPPSS